MLNSLINSNSDLKENKYLRSTNQLIQLKIDCRRQTYRFCNTFQILNSIHFAGLHARSEIFLTNSDNSIYYEIVEFHFADLNEHPITQILITQELIH